MDQRIATYVVCASLILFSSIYVLVHPQAVDPATPGLQQREHVAGDMPPGCRLPGNMKVVWPMHVPDWHRQPAVGGASQFAPARQGLPELGGTHHSQQGEDQYAYSKFFHGKVAGSYLEVRLLPWLCDCVLALSFLIGSPLHLAYGRFGAAMHASSAHI